MKAKTWNHDTWLFDYRTQCAAFGVLALDHDVVRLLNACDAGLTPYGCALDMNLGPIPTT